MALNPCEMISFGAGVNSVAMTIMLVNDGWRGPIVFADTGGEHPETYCYITYFERWLKERGLGITRLMPGTEWHCSMSQVPLETYCLRAKVVPILGIRWCSSRWKGRPIDRWATAQGITAQYLAFSVDEARRANGKPDAYEYPLIDRRITRDSCLRLIAQAGLEQPCKSSCFFCPGQTVGELRRLYYAHPELYERAALLEDNASTHHQRKVTLKSSGLSLRDYADCRWEGQTEMDLSEWIPCLCSL